MLPGDLTPAKRPRYDDQKITITVPQSVSDDIVNTINLALEAARLLPDHPDVPRMLGLSSALANHAQVEFHDHASVLEQELHAHCVQLIVMRDELMRYIAVFPER